ncbi:MAG TPA: hypothetical protein VEF76_06480 [Patescibacteria group bacterium]|nr:hypothetical protein [Patescibacteria group bacterium]
MKDHQRQTLVKLSAVAAFASVAATALFAPFAMKNNNKTPAPPPPKPSGKTVKVTPPFRTAAEKKTTTVTAPSGFLWNVTETKAPDFFAQNSSLSLSLATPQPNPLFNIDVKLGPTPQETAKQKAYAEHLKRAQKIRAAHEAKVDALRDRLNDGLMAYTNAALSQGIGRNIPAEKGPDNAAAAFVYQAAQLAFHGFTSAAPEKGVKKKDIKVFDGTAVAQLTGSSAHQINAVAAAVKTPRLARDSVNIETLKPGMIIGIEENKSGKIDKTAITYLDAEKGRLIVAMGVAGAGVKIMTARDFLQQAAERGDILQAADIVPYIAAKGAAPKTKFKYDTSPDALAGIGADEGAFLRATISMGIEQYTKDAVRRGVTYSFGDDSGKTSIDCSGFVRKCVLNAQAHVVGSPIVKGADEEFPRVSVDQFTKLETVTGAVLAGDTLSVKTLREGMVIAMDHGPSFKDGEQWDAGRERGIDHIGIVYRDSATRQLMLAESSGGIGVHATRLPDFLEKKKDRGAKLYGVDLVAYAAKQGWKPTEKTITVKAAKSRKPAGAAKHKNS